MQFSGELVIAATVEGVSGLTVGPVHQRKNTADAQKKPTAAFFLVPLQVRDKQENNPPFFF